MKKFTKAGAKFAAAAAVSVMALGYTTSVCAEDNTVVKIGKEFADIKGTQTENMSDIFLPFEPAKNVQGIGLDIHNVEKLNLINSDELWVVVIRASANAHKKGESVGIAVKDAQADFDIKDGSLAVLANGAVIGTEANVSMKAVGFYGEKGSSQIKAESVYYNAENENNRETGTLNEETLGMDLNKFAINMLAKDNIEISSLIPTENMLAGEKTAQGMVLSNRSKASLQAENDINILAAVGHDPILTRAMPAISFGPVNGIHADSSELDMQAGNKINIEASINGYTSNNNLAAINASNSKINMKAAGGIKIIADNGDAIVADNKSEITLDSGSSRISIRGNVNVADHSAVALDGSSSGIDIRGNVNVADKSEVALDGGDIGIDIRGNVNVSDNSTLKLSGQTGIMNMGGVILRSAPSGGAPSGSNFNVYNSKLVVDGFTKISGTTTFEKAKIYMYDANNAEDKFHYLAIRDLEIIDSNELFLRADSSEAAGNVNSDFIGIGGAITGDGSFDVNIFDKGMKNGYGMSKDGTKGLEHPITVLYNRNILFADASLINSVKDVHYDNGIWSYTYDDMRAKLDDSDNRKIVIEEVKVTAAPSASGSQRNLHSANKAAGALAIGVLGNDSALHAHLREAQGAGEREEVWAQYLGGKLKSDGMQLKHNGVELGYDAYVGNNWTFGVSGMQTRGNTQLDSGSGKAKTNVGTVYGAWHGGSTYLNLEAKAGRVSSESKTFGGTVLQKIAGEFSAPAYSVSAEYGSTHKLPAAWYLEPAVRLSYVHLCAADYGVQVQDTLARVANDSLDSFILRGGAKLGRRLGAKGSFYVKAAAVYDFGGDLATTVSADGRTAHYEDSLGGWGVEYGAGLEYKLGKAANISLDVERRSGGELKRDWGVNIGVNYSF